MAIQQYQYFLLSYKKMDVVILEHGTTKVVDNIGHSFRRLPILTGDGLCMYRSISYCFYGKGSRYTDVITDFIDIFLNCKLVFNHHTDWARDGGDLATYQSGVQSCLSRLCTVDDWVKRNGSTNRLRSLQVFSSVILIDYIDI